jgi:hypothetical protein
MGTAEKLKKITSSKNLEDAFLKLTGHEIRREEVSGTDLMWQHMQRRFGRR